MSSISSSISESNSSYDFIFFFSLYEVFSTYKSFIFTDGSIILDSSSDSKGRQRERGGGVDVTRRLQLIRILEKMENDPKFSEKLGIKNRSEFIPVSMTGEKEKLL